MLNAEQITDWSRFKHLTNQTKENLSNPTWDKSKAINKLLEIQHRKLKEAKESQDSAKLKEAERFCLAIEKEIQFYRNSK